MCIWGARAAAHAVLGRGGGGTIAIKGDANMQATKHSNHNVIVKGVLYFMVEPQAFQVQFRHTSKTVPFVIVWAAVVADMHA